MNFVTKLRIITALCIYSLPGCASSGPEREPVPTPTVDFASLIVSACNTWANDLENHDLIPESLKEYYAGDCASYFDSQAYHFTELDESSADHYAMLGVANIANGALDNANGTRAREMLKFRLLRKFDKK